MGIPSYYKKLVHHIQGLRSQGKPVNDIQWFFMDFNCLIYHCLHSMPVYSSSDKEAWEQTLIESVVSYCLFVIKQVQPKKGVYIAIDGVVPMAKMRQQRLRRFKSAWLSESEKWDTNAITPGTMFMGKLRVGLESMIEKHGKVGWTLSSSDEPGEGEHKIMAEWRKGVYKGDFAVYGLDADLIVLSMLGQACNSLQNKIWLFREDVTPSNVGDAKKEDVFEWFSIDLLRDWITSSAPTDVEKHKFILNYCFAMSVLGNDFLPSSLGLKIREDGHGELVYLLQTMMSRQIHLIHPDTLQISFQGVRTLFTLLTTNEENRIRNYITKKQMFARQLGAHSGKVGDNNWPLFHIEEEVLLENKAMCSNWKELYLTRFFTGHSYHMNTINRVCNEYLYGMQWIWGYYTGGDICYNWYYPHALPPLWEWLRDFLQKSDKLPVLPDILLHAADIRPVEQLSIVLPLESWSLIPPCLEKTFPKVAPHFFPTSFSFESVGKRFFWECESLIPLPTIMELKRLLQIR